jgi:predicted kinase
MIKELILLRGIPGAGKSTLAKSLGGVNLEADMYHLDANGDYKWIPENVKKAHAWCQLLTEHRMEDGFEKIVVSNTFTQEWEMQPYFDLAEKYGYRVYSLIVENRHGGVNGHNVPEDVIEKMKTRFEVKL